MADESVSTLTFKLVVASDVEARTVVTARESFALRRLCHITTVNNRLASYVR